MNTEAKDLIRSLRRIHAAISILLCLVVLVTYVALGSNLNAAGTRFVSLNAIVPLVFALLALTGWKINKNRISKIQLMGNPHEKLDAYRKLQIIQYGLLEAAFLLAVIVFVKTRELNYLIYAVLMLIYLVYIRPNKLKLRKDLGLEMDDL